MMKLENNNIKQNLATNTGNKKNNLQMKISSLNKNTNIQFMNTQIITNTNV